MKLRYLVLAALASLVTGFVIMVQNHSAAIKSAQEILAHDNAGKDTTAELTALQNFVRSHMRTGVTFKLESSYTRAVEAARAASLPQINGSVYQAATNACSKEKVASAQTKCVVNYVSSHSQPGTTKPLVLPDEALFRRVYTAPEWTPDLAGLLIAFGAIALILTAVYTITRRLTAPRSHRPS